MSKVIVYTDGSSLGNPGPGGYGIVLMFGKHRKEIFKGFRKTTNNRMELMAVVEALKSLKREGLDVIIHSDSEYVIKSITKGWVYNWKKNGFKKKKNPDLWLKFLEVYEKHNVEFKWVKAHVGIPENEKCDQLAKHGAENPTEIDNGYENPEEGKLFN